MALITETTYYIPTEFFETNAGQAYDESKYLGLSLRVNQVNVKIRFTLLGDINIMIRRHY